MPDRPETAGFYGEFLTELKRLDQFLAYRTGDDAFIGREDPDVRRLMESLAFFSTCTQQLADQRLRTAIQELARGHLDDFVTTQPARGMLRATPGGQFQDKHVLPGGTRVRLTTADGDVGLFSTMCGLTIRPLHIDHAEFQPRPGSGYRLLVRVRARREIADMAEPLAIHVSYLDDYESSLRFITSLRAHLPRAGAAGASVFYDAAPDPTRVGAPCELGFGCPPQTRPASPVERIREFFHFPDKELYVNVSLPRPARPWRTAWLCFDVTDRWPLDLIVNKDFFRLFVVPIENLLADLAAPFKADGTRSSYAIDSAQPDGKFSLHSVTRVYQETPTGPDPILPGFLASGDESYDVEYIGDGHDEPEHRLILRLPSAFVRPRAIGIEGLWYQRWFDRVAVGKLDALLQTRYVAGVTFKVQGQLTPHKPSALWSDSTAMLRVLARRTNRTLSRRDIVHLMAVLGATEDSYYGDIGAAILHVEHFEEPAQVRRGGVRQVYRITVDVTDDDRRGLVESYLARVYDLLDSWSTNPVTIEIAEPATGKAGTSEGSTPTGLMLAEGRR